MTVSSQVGQALVLTQIRASIVANSQANTVGSTYRTLSVTDGSTAGTALWQTRVGMPASSGWEVSVQLDGLYVQGTLGSSMTISFIGIASTNTLYAIAASGVTR